LSLHEKDWWSICYHKKRAEFLDLIELDFRINGLQTDLEMTKEFIADLKKPQGFLGVKGMESHCS